MDMVLGAAGALLPAAKPAGVFSRKLFASFKKAAWIASTTSLVLLIPLIIEMDREQQIIELEKEQMSVLTGAAPAK